MTVRLIAGAAAEAAGAVAPAPNRKD